MLRSSTVGALPILDHLLRRMRLDEFLQAYLPTEDRRTKLAASKALLVLLRNLLLSREPIYGVGECKLATSENMAYLHQRQGRFVTVLPRTRAEDAAFRDLVVKGRVTWRPLWKKTDDQGEIMDYYTLSDQPATTAEGYRLVWYHSQRKAELDAVARSGRTERALKQLAALREKLRSPRTRYRQEAKGAEAVAEILPSCKAAPWIVTEVQPHSVETFHQDHRGRPGKDTRYVKKVATRFDLAYHIEATLLG